jgi:hypothetical protein
VAITATATLLRVMGAQVSRSADSRQADSVTVGADSRLGGGKARAGGLLGSRPHDRLANVG